MSNESSLFLLWKSQDEVQQLVQGHPGVCICNECIHLCRQLVEDDQTDEAESQPVVHLPKPKGCSST